MTEYQQKALKAIMDIIIIQSELDIINELKVQALREQKYERAVELRQKEIDFYKTLPALEEIKLIRKNLDHPVNEGPLI